MKFLTAGLMHVTTGLETARYARRLSDPAAGVRHQEKVLQQLIAGLAKARYGIEHGVEAGMDDQSFRRNVPLATAQSIQPYVDAVIGGAPDELWPGRCRHFVRTNGGTAGPPRQLPLNDSILEHYHEAAYQIALMHTAGTGHAGVFHGRHVYLAETASLRTGQADLPGILTETMPRWTEKFLFVPGQETASIVDRDARIQKTAEEALSQDITLLAGSPRTLIRFTEAVLAQTSAAGRPIRTLTDAWPNLECVIHGGHSVIPYLEALTQRIGRRVVMSEVFAITEAIVAAQDGKPDGALRLLDDTGVYFEFLPLHAKPEDQKQALPLSAIRAEVDYELVVTTPAGLCRYRTDEIVRFVSAKPPRLIYRGRRSLALQLGNTLLMDRDLNDIMAKVCRRHNWVPEGFHVNPLHTESGDCHEWWVELKPPCRETPISKIIEEELDDGLRTTSHAYLEHRESGALHPPIVRLITPGVFELCRKEIGRQNGEHSFPVARSDRQVAEQLMQYAGVQAD